MVAFRAVYYFLPLLIAAVSLGAHEVVRRREQVGSIARAFGGRAPRRGAADPRRHHLPRRRHPAGLRRDAGGPLAPLLARRHPAAAGDRDLPLPRQPGGRRAALPRHRPPAPARRRLPAHPRCCSAAASSSPSPRGSTGRRPLLLAADARRAAPCRRHFYRKASLTAEPFTPGWIARHRRSCSLGSVWLGFFAYKHVDYSHDLWWQLHLLRQRAALPARLGGAWRRGARRRPQPPAAAGAARARAAQRGGARARRRRSPPRARAPTPTSPCSATSSCSSTTRGQRVPDVRRRAAGAGWRWAIRWGPTDERARARLAVPRAGRPARRLDRLLPGERADPPALRRPRPDAAQAGRGGARAARRLLARGRNRKKLRHAQRRCDEEGCTFEVVPPRGGRRPCCRSCERISDDWLQQQEHAGEGVLARLLRPATTCARLPLALVRQGDRDRGVRQPLAGRRATRSSRSTSCATPPTPRGA